jgi:hypothetical protein
MKTPPRRRGGSPDTLPQPLCSDLRRKRNRSERVTAAAYYEVRIKSLLLRNTKRYYLLTIHEMTVDLRALYLAAIFSLWTHTVGEYEGWKPCRQSAKLSDESKISWYCPTVKT